jgi:hypothetical protein
MFLLKVIRNGGRNSTWFSALGALRVAVICLTLMSLNLKSSRLLEISSAGVSGGR